MAIDHRELYVTDAPPAVATGFVRRLLRELALQDWLVLVYLSVLVGIALRCPPSAARDVSVPRMAALLVFLAATLVLVRGGLVRHGVLAPLLYRFALYGTVQLTYFFLAPMLPVVNTTTLDLELYRLDLTLFGFEPAIAMDAIVNPWTTEWFAFFYFGYFYLLAVHVIPMMFFARVRMISEFALGILIVFCIGHVVYMMVPGYGPHHALAGEFKNPLPHGLWRDTVMATVASGGAQLDIFPSLHTAAPAFLTLFSFRHRDKVPFRYTWPLVAFFAVNIILATMFLRWHYVIDVVAGLALATAGFMLSSRLTRAELRRRSAWRLSENWPRFELGRS